MEAENKEPEQQEDMILDLDELVVPAGEFRCNGQMFVFLEMGTMGLLQQKEIEKAWSDIQKFRALNHPKPSQEAAYEKTIRKCITLISDMPAEFAADVPINKLMQALVCFFSFRTASQVALVVRMAEIAGNGKDMTGGKASLDSIISGLKQTPMSG